MSEISQTNNPRLPQPANSANPPTTQIPLNERIALLQLEKQTFEEDYQISTSPKIQRVPAILLQNPKFAKYYSPKMISFGPIHHGDRNLEQGEHYKLLWTSRYIKEYIGITNQIASEVAHSLLKKIQDQLGELKKLFTEDAIGSKTTDDDLAWMLFVDGCSLLHFMKKIDKHHPQALNIKLDQMMHMWRDIIMLENQLPMILLELLSKNEANLVNLMVNFYVMGDKRFKESEFPLENKSKLLHILDLARSCFMSKKEDVDLEKLSGSVEVKIPLIDKPKPIHILDCIRSFLTSTSDDFNTHKDHDKENGKDGKSKQDGDEHKQISPHEKQNVWLTYKNIRDLKAAGIRVKPSMGLGRWKWSSVSFTSNWLFWGELRVPVFVFDNVSPYFFRNLIAYEMCPDFQNNLECCSFFCFMDSLIDGGDDVKELRLAGVIQNLLGTDEELAKLFINVGSDLPTKIFNNTWSTDAVAYSKKYIQVKNQIEKHYTSKLKTLVAVGINTYFSTPWSILAFLAASTALALTAAQTYYNVHPKHSLVS